MGATTGRQPCPRSGIMRMIEVIAGKQLLYGLAASFVDPRRNSQPQEGREQSSTGEATSRAAHGWRGARSAKRPGMESTWKWLRAT